MTFHFLRPGALLLLPLLLLLLGWRLRRPARSHGWQAVCDPALLPHLLLGRGGKKSRWPAGLLLVGILLAVVALSGPSWRSQPLPLYRSQEALVILLDLSRSMLAADLRPSRLEQARLKVEDLLRQRREGETALIAFAGEAFVVTPLTDDIETIRSLLATLTPELMPVQGGETARGLAVAQALLTQAGVRHGRVLLLTDDDRPARAQAAAEALQQQAQRGAEELPFGLIGHVGPLQRLPHQQAADALLAGQALDLWIVQI